MLRVSVSSDETPPDIKEPHFHNPIDYVKRTASWLDRFGVMPQAGGLNDQDKFWVQDMEMHFGMLGQVTRKQAEYEKEKSKSKI